MAQRINRPVPITYIQMGALTAQEWQSFSIEITRPSNRGNQETEKTPYDLRLGALANGVVCETCGESNKNCPGHWGYIPLEEPCYNPEYINYVLGLLKCICIKCYAPRISENMAGSILSLQRNVRFNTYKKKAETLKQCSECKAPLASFIIDKHTIKMFYEDKKNATHITAREASAILMQISSSTMTLLGFNHDLSQNPKFTSDDIVLPQEKNHIHEIRPDAFIFMVLPVLPTCARPWVIKGSEKKDDDITDKYNTILKNNERLRIDRESPMNAQPVKGRKKNGKLSESDRFRTIEDMHSNIWSMIDNSKEKNKNSGRKHKGLCERLEKKGGHIQINVAGKRSDFTARTVIVGGGSLLRMDQVGIPQHFAKTLTSPEIVLDWNIGEYEKMLAAGKINTVCRGQFNIDVREVTAKGTKPFVWKGQTGLQIFDVVHRQLRNGDWAIFNRQPTLRIESMQGAKVFILPSRSIFQTEYTMRLPLAVTRPYNADFDGDEFNMHAPQNKGAITECSTISRTAYHIISAQNNAPVMGCVQNTLVCMYIITETFETPEETAEDKTPNYQFPDGSMGYQTMIDLSDFMDAIQAASISLERYQDLLRRAAKYYPDYVYKYKGHLKFLDRIPGKIVASIVFPSTFTWSRMTGVNEKLPLVDIKDGIIQPNSGPLDKKIIGGVGGSAIHPLWKISPDTAVNVISELQFLQSVLITRIGFSMGASDCVPTGEIDVQGAITEALLQCEMIISSSKDPVDKEREINGALNEAMSIAPRLAKKGMNKLDRNALVIMKKSGAKGSDTNNGQIAGFVGQQNIDGKRMPTTLSNGTRSLPHFNKGDKSPAALGFVQHSYLEGLSFTEVWFHATGGRRGVVDTAMKSVTYETEILIEEEGDIKKYKIGAWIDEMLENTKEVEYHNERNMELLNIPSSKIYIPTTDTKGNVSWGLITAVTRHDPGDALYKITTRSGRSVIVTESKSLLVWDSKKKEFIQTNGDKVKVGDLVPTTLNLPRPPTLFNLFANSSSQSESGYISGVYFCLGKFEIPERFISASKEFIQGFVDGYFFQNGCATAISFLEENMVMLSILCSRVGIFGTLSKDCDLYLYKIRNTQDFQNDVVKDEVIKIEVVDVAEHPHVYDLTVPATTNFCLANGLHVVDTADSGYIQKKIVNTINDFKAIHDGSVRDANGSIVQFAYGGDGMNAKELIPCKGLDYPFFANPLTIADSLNSKAERLAEDEGVDIGKLRVLTKAETTMLTSFIEYTCAGKKTEVSERVTFNIRTCLRAAIAKVKIYEYMIPNFCRKLKDEFEEARVKNGYMAGLVASSCIGEPTTQMTLNSVDWNTIIYVRIEADKLGLTQGGVVVAPIGKIIDTIIDNAKVVFHYENETEYVDVKDMKAQVTCVDENGKMHWKELEAVTRHLPGGNLVEIKTRLGRTVKVTKSKSLLIRENNKIVGKLGADITVGDYVPLVMVAPKVENPLQEVKMDCYLPKKDFIHGTEMEKMKEYKESGVHAWWAKGKDIKFEVPYARGDSAAEGLTKKYVSGAIYPKTSGHVVSILPEKLVMDRLTGFLFGAYLSEGCATDMYVSIANNDQAFLDRISEWCDRYSIGWHITRQTDKNFVGSTSTDIRAHSNLLAKVLNESCGKGSANKCIPSWALIADLDFVRGLLDGYFSGDGTINKKGKYISCSSASAVLLDGISELCSRLGIFGSRSVHYVEKNNIGSKNILPVNTFSVRNGFAKIFATEIKLVASSKQNLLDVISETTYRKHGGLFDLIPGVNIGEYKGMYHREDLQKMLDTMDNLEEKAILQEAVESEAFFDEIVSVEEVESSTSKVYDLTVADTRNFTVFGGLCVRDTFHNAGNSAKDVTLGVPRFKELINATKNPSKPTCTVYLTNEKMQYIQEKHKVTSKKIKEAESKGDTKKVEELKQTLAELDKEGLYNITGLAQEFTYLSADFFIKSHVLRYLAVDGEVPEASPIGILTYEEYSPKWWVTLAEGMGKEPNFPPKSWVLVLSLDIDKMYRFGVSAEQIAIKIEENSFGTRGYALACVSSPDNIGEIEVYLNFSEIGEYVRSEIDLSGGEEITRRLLTSENVEYFVARDVAMDIIGKTEVRGIKNIEKTYVRQEYKTGEWVVDTQGTNLQRLLGTPGVDATRTMSDDMWEIYNTFGIEVTRSFLYKEKKKILSFDGTYINPRHLYLLVDGMCRSGVITSVNRDGIPRNVGPIAKCMFEKAVDNFRTSAAFVEYDKMKGVAASVMFGALAEVGSGTVDIKDTEKLPAKRRVPIEIPLKPRKK